MDKNDVEMIGKDEMNLCEYPITLLSTKNPKNLKTIVYEDTIVSPDGTEVIRSWMVTGPDPFGLPLSQDNALLIALLAIGKLNNFQSRQIYFSRHQLCKIMNVTPQKDEYKRIIEGLDRLSAVSIKAINAFWDNEKKRLLYQLFWNT